MRTDTVNRFPARHRAFDHVRHLLHQAEAAVVKLQEMGILVTEVQVSGHQPVIWVQASPQCRALDGVVMIRRNTARGHEHTMAAPFEGCQVQWAVRMGWQ